MQKASVAQPHFQALLLQQMIFSHGMLCSYWLAQFLPWHWKRNIPCKLVTGLPSQPNAHFSPIPLKCTR